MHRGAASAKGVGWSWFLWPLLKIARNQMANVPNDSQQKSEFLTHLTGKLKLRESLCSRRASLHAEFRKRGGTRLEENRDTLIYSRLEYPDAHEMHALLEKHRHLLRHQLRPELEPIVNRIERCEEEIRDLDRHISNCLKVAPLEGVSSEETAELIDAHNARVRNLTADSEESTEAGSASSQTGPTPATEAESAGADLAEAAETLADKVQRTESEPTEATTASNLSDSPVSPEASELDEPAPPGMSEATEITAPDGEPANHSLTSASASLKPDKGGRPRRDDVRKRIGELRAEGKSWGQVKTKLNAELNQDLSEDAYRLLFSR